MNLFPSANAIPVVKNTTKLEMMILALLLLSISASVLSFLLTLDDVSDADTGTFNVKSVLDIQKLLY